MNAPEQTAEVFAILEREARERLLKVDELVAQASAKLEALNAQLAAVESLVQGTSVHSQSISAAVSEAQAKVAEIVAAATQAGAAKTQVVDLQAVIATKSDHIEQAQIHADKVRADLDRALTAANQQVTEAEGLKARAQSSSDTADNLLIEVKTVRSAAEADGAAVTKARSDAEDAANVSSGLATKAETIEGRVLEYEKKLAELAKSSEVQLETIVGLLPGATSAGLAHAFDDRRKTFIKPSLRWQWLFVGSVVLLVVLAGTGLWQVVYGTTAGSTYHDLIRLWLARLPIAGALVWLALYAGRESSLAKRLEEDYGYKSAVAASFLGFHKQLSDIGKASESNAPLAKLCTDTLTTIASPPGRIYDKHRLVVSPGAELTEAAKSVLDASGAIKGKQD